MACYDRPRHLALKSQHSSSYSKLRLNSVQCSRISLSCSSVLCFFFSSRRRHTRSLCDWSSDVCSSDLHSPATRLWSSKESTAWTVVYEADARFQISCLNRFIYVKGVSDVTEVLHNADEIGRASCRERV